MIRPATPDAIRLFHEGAAALAQVSANGFRIDTDYLDKALKETADRIRTLGARLKECDEWTAWQKQFGVNANLSSGDQLGYVLYTALGHTCHEYTDTGKPSTDNTAIEKIDSPFTKNLLRFKKLEKAYGTYLDGIRRETDHRGYLHPFFNLHTVQTYRGSSDSINFQNQPIRDPWFGELIRTAFIPRDGHRLVEVDFGGIEVCVAYCYHLDPTMGKYLAEGYDMHRDMGGECYKIPSADVPKAVRQQAKALFVFAEFYGDYYLKCAMSLWEAIGRHKLVTKDGVGLYDHLISKGINERGACDPSLGFEPVPGTFEAHIKAVESDFWKRRFPVYNQWRRDWYAAYQQEGGFNTLTGFAINGVHDRNFVINAPVQGSAFHCLLWCLIELQKWLRKHKMRSLIVGQIHDSIVLDVHKSEEAEVLAKTKSLMTKEIMEHWPWIATQLKIEAESSEVNWWQKKPLAI